MREVHGVRVVVARARMDRRDQEHLERSAVRHSLRSGRGPHRRARRREHDAELRDRKERLTRTDEKMAGLADFIASGDRSKYIVTTLHDLEIFADQERAAIAQLAQDSRQPLRLPSIDEVEARVRQLDQRLKQDPEGAREQLRRWIKDGSIRVGPREDGAIVAEGGLLPFVVISDCPTEKSKTPRNPMIPRSSTGVAGVGFEPTTFGL